jgi:hypothetical protein
MTSEAITSALAAGQAIFLPMNGPPSDNNLVHLSNGILSILLKATYFASTASTTCGALLLAQIAISTTTVFPLYAQLPVQPAMIRQSTRKLLASTAIVLKLPGLL